MDLSERNGPCHPTGITQQLRDHEDYTSCQTVFLLAVHSRYCDVPHHPCLFCPFYPSYLSSPSYPSSSPSSHLPLHLPVVIATVHFDIDLPSITVCIQFVFLFTSQLGPTDYRLVVVEDESQNNRMTEGK